MPTPTSLGTVVPPRIADALTTATARTGEGFDYLLNTARRESALNERAAAPTSSARGLFQFVEQTWLGTVKETGARHGLAAYAEQIDKTATGRYAVQDPDARRAILALRNDPHVSSVMAGELTASNRAELTGRLGRAPTEGELYIAHFLGASGAGRLIETAARTPGKPAADMFPQAARANRSIFFAADGRPRSAASVYAGLVSQHDGTASTQRSADTARTAAAAPFKAVASFFESLFQGLFSIFTGGSDRSVDAPTAIGRRASSSAPAAASGVTAPAGWNLFAAAYAPDAQSGSEMLRAHRTYAMDGAATVSTGSGGGDGASWSHGLFTTDQRSDSPFAPGPPPTTA